MATVREIGIAELLQSSLDDDDFLSHLADNHERRLLGAINGLREDITDMLNKLDTTPRGTLAATKANIKMAQSMHTQLVKEFEKSYNVTVDEMLGDFSSISDVVKRRFRSFGDAIAFTGIDKTIMDQLRLQTYRQFAAFGEEARDAIAAAMYDHVIRGQKFSTLRNTIAGVLTGHTDARGRPMSLYATTFAHDAVHDFHNAVTLKKAEDLNYTHYLYVGDVIQTSRPFCITRAGKVYTKRTIDSWDSMPWQGKRGPAFQYRGGYNCRHHWRPVRKEWLEDELGEEISQEEIVARMAADAGDDEAKRIAARVDAKEKELKESSARTDELKTKYYAMKGKKGKEFTKERAALYAEYKEGVAMRKILRAELKELKDELKAYGAAVKKKAKPKPKAAPKPKKPELKVVKGGKPPKVSGVDPHERLADRGVYGIVDFSEDAYDNFIEMIVKPVADAVEHMTGLSPLIADALSSHPITHIKFVKDKYLGKLAERWKSTFGIHGGTRMAIAADNMVLERSIMKLTTPWSSSTSTHAAHLPSITFRHEFGHHVHSILFKRYAPLNKFDEAWDNIWNKHGKSWWESKVTNYSATNVKEAFAEAWAIRTSKHYRKGMLPKEIEDFFDNLFKGEIPVVKLPPVKKVTLKKAAERPPLNTRQKQTIKFADDTGKLTTEKTRRIAEYLGIEPEEVQQLAQMVADNAVISVRRQLHSATAASYKDIFKNGKFKNQFQLGKNAGSSSGYLGPYKGSGRDRWERALSNGTLQKNPAYRKVSDGADLPAAVAGERPIYGFLRDPIHPGSASQYGDIEFVLHDKFKANVTLTSGNSSAVHIPDGLGTLENSAPILRRLAGWIRGSRSIDEASRYVRRLLSGQETLGGWADGAYSYVEAQVYGGIDLARGDVVKIIVHKSDYGSGLSHIRQLAERYNIPVEFL